MRGLLVALSVLLASTASAGERLVVCDVGGPGNTAQAQTAMNDFLRHLEKLAGLEADQFSGAYHTDEKSCAAWIEAEKPMLAVFDLPTYLQRAKALQLEPVAHLGPPDAETYRVVVKKGAFADLAALQGKKLISAHLRDPRFASKVVFAGKVDVGAHFATKKTKRPLKAVRSVARGKADAALLDTETFGHIADLKLGEPLEAIFTSAAVPDLVLAKVGVHADAEDAALVDKVRAAIPKLCADAGAELCKNFGIDRVVPADAPRMKALRSAYDG